MPKADPTPHYDFRTVEEADLALLGRWLGPDEVTKIREHIDSVSVEPLIVEREGDPIAYLQSYDPHLEDDHPYADQPFGTLGVDLTIRPEKLQSSNYGSTILAQFVEELFDEGATRVIVTPQSSNTQAIRAYEKAGFQAQRERTNEYGQVLLMMALNNPEDDV